MPRIKGKKPYFGMEQEAAVVRFLSASTWDEKNKVYNDHLRKPLNTMVESIIRKYKLYRDDMSFINMHDDTLSFLITKCDKFKPEKGKKAYSYFGTIVKNYLLGQLIKDDKKLRTDLRYDDVYKTVETMDDFIYNNIEDKDKTPLDIFIGEISASIKLELETTKLNENEIKVGNSLVTVLDSWETIFEQIESGNKYNKNLILSYIREMTDLSTKDIRVSMKKFKKIYILLKNDKIDNGLI